MRWCGKTEAKDRKIYVATERKITSYNDNEKRRKKEWNCAELLWESRDWLIHACRIQSRNSMFDVLVPAKWNQILKHYLSIHGCEFCAYIHAIWNVARMLFFFFVVRIFILERINQSLRRLGSIRFNWNGYSYINRTFTDDQILYIAE